MSFVFEGDFYLGPISLHLAVGDDHVEIHHLGHPQVAQVFAGSLDRNLGGFLPGRCASADHFDNFIDALRLGCFSLDP